MTKQAMTIVFIQFIISNTNVFYLPTLPWVNFNLPTIFIFLI